MLRGRDASDAETFCAAISTFPPSGMAWSAFRTMFWTTWTSCPSSASTRQRSGALEMRYSERDPLSANLAAFSITGKRDKLFFTGFFPPSQGRGAGGERPDGLELLGLEPFFFEEVFLRDVVDRLDHRGDTA